VTSALPQAPESAARPRSRRTLAWVSTANFGEGLPWSVLHQMGTEFLTAAKASSTQISSTSLFHLAVTLKFLWSPVVDLFGKKRTWVVATQLTLAGGMIAIGLASKAPSLAAFWIVASLFAVLHATHDIACDGFYLRALDGRDQALYSGVRTAAFRVAMLVGGSWLVVLAGRTSFRLAFVVAGALMLVTALVNAWLLPRPPEARPVVAPTRAARAAAFLEAYKTFLGQPKAALVLGFMLVYRLGDIMMFSMSKPLLRDIGVDTASRGALYTPTTITFIVGALVGGGIIARRGLARTLVPLTYVQNLAIPLYVALAVWKPSFPVVAGIAIVEQLASGLGQSAYTVFMMQRTRGTFSASHYAFATAIVALASTLSGWLSGPLDDRFGHVAFFTIAFVASWPSLALVWFVPKTPIEPPASVGAASG
jgi:MFS transporter, PAT family, beta-lactamase induction signal transducer AmpG